MTSKRGWGQISLGKGGGQEVSNLECPLVGDAALQTLTVSPTFPWPGPALLPPHPQVQTGVIPIPRVELSLPGAWSVARLL